ncbi:MAG TPA: hypothetical protein VHD83_01855 [Puia sp.]|nr:hypothetical protein [Puia sp.]
MESITYDFRNPKSLEYRSAPYLELQQRSRNAQIIPILFEPLDLGGVPSITPGDATQSMSISTFEIAPKTDQGQLLAVSLWDNTEEALAKIATSIRMAIQKN